MFGFGKHGPDGRYGVLYDIGSGSVGVMIAVSDPLQLLPTIIWQHRERVSVKESGSLVSAARDITTAFINASLELSTSGLKALAAYDPAARISLLNVSIAAPWSYTITKTISSSDEKPFTITPTLVNEIIRVAEREALEVIDQNEVTAALDLEVIRRTTIDLKANGYTVRDPYGQKVNRLTISHLNSLAQRKMLGVVRDTKEKLFPKAELSFDSFMYTFYRTLQDRASDTSELCLIDITAEATELGVVRDGILRYVTHMPHGMYSLARAIAESCHIPREEALGHLRESDASLAATLSAAKQGECGAAIETYEANLADLFTRTGDALSIPRTMFVHTDIRTEPFFRDRIAKAVSGAYGSEPAIHFITSQLFPETKTADTALLLSAFVFHKRLNETVFK